MGDERSNSLTALKQYKVIDPLLILLFQLLSLELDADFLEARGLTFQPDFMSQTQQKLKNFLLYSDK